MKVIDFKEKRASRNGEYTPKTILQGLLDTVDEIEAIVYVIKTKDGTIQAGRNTMLDTQTLGFLRVGE